MRLLLTVSCVVLIYVVGLMTATGTSLWTAAISDQEAATLFGGGCDTVYDDAACSGSARYSSCQPYSCYWYTGTGNTIRVSDQGIRFMCAGGNNTNCGVILSPLQGCMTGG